MAGARTQFPLPALDWLIEGRQGHFAVLSDTAAIPRLLAHDKRQILTIAHSTENAAQLAHNSDLVTVTARPENLPLAACSIDIVFVHQTLHHFDPGLTLPEFARVLAPDGWVAASQMIRDDSVPWVRKLIDLMRSADPNAMEGDFGAESISTLRSSKYFPFNEAKEFRVWASITPQQLTDMVKSQPFFANLTMTKRASLLRDAEQLYSSAGSGRTLRLPYKMLCVKAHVDHTELTIPIQLSDDALIIDL